MDFKKAKVDLLMDPYCGDPLNIDIGKDHWIVICTLPPEHVEEGQPHTGHISWPIVIQP